MRVRAYLSSYHGVELSFSQKQGERVTRRAGFLPSVYWCYGGVLLLCTPSTSTSTSRVESAPPAVDAGAPLLFGRLDFPSPYFRGEFGSRGSRGSFATSGSARNPAVARASSSSSSSSSSPASGVSGSVASPEPLPPRGRSLAAGTRTVRFAGTDGGVLASATDADVSASPAPSPGVISTSPPSRPSIVGWRGAAPRQHLPRVSLRSRRRAIAPASRGGPIVFTPRHPQHAAQNHGGKHRHIAARRAAARRGVVLVVPMSVGTKRDEETNLMSDVSVLRTVR